MAPRPRADAVPSTFQRVDTEKSHYYLDGDKRIDAVTQLTGGAIHKPALPQSAANLTARKAVDEPGSTYDQLRFHYKEEWRAKADRGTLLHEVVEGIHNGSPFPMEEIAPELHGAVAAYQQFLEDYRPSVIAAEAWLINRLGAYAGTLDLLAAIPGLGTCLLDLKTGASGVWPEVALQLAAYRNAQAYCPSPGWEVKMPKVDHCLVVWLTPDDSYQVLPVDAGEAAWLGFKWAAMLTRWVWAAEQHSPIGEPLPPRPALEGALL